MFVLLFVRGFFRHRWRRLCGASGFRRLPDARCQLGLELGEFRIRIDVTGTGRAEVDGRQGGVIIIVGVEAAAAPSSSSRSRIAVYGRNIFQQK
jgi:hypothetical protein